MTVETKRPSRWPTALVGLLACVVLPPIAAGQLPRDLIEEALDQPVAAIEIASTALPQALAELGEKTGLRFVLSPDVPGLMPYGERTQIAISLKNASVRQAVGQVIERLGLRMEIDGDRLRIDPAPFLARVGRRLTLEELGAIEKLAARSWSEMSADPAGLRLDARVDGKSDAESLSRVQGFVRDSRAASAIEQLNEAAQRAGAVWRIDGPLVIVEPPRDEIRRRLDWPLDLTFQRQPLDAVLVDLGQRVGVTMKFEPGSLRQISARDRMVDLVQRGVSVRQTLERICGNTGLRYEVHDDGVQIRPPADGGAAAPATGAQLARLSIEIRPGVNVEVLVGLDQLPPDIRADVEKRLAEILAVPTSATRP